MASSLQPGVKLGRYEIRSRIGAGGMGEVYRALDPELGREVAIKVLPPDFAADADRLRRFEQEARAAGTLNHPNILAIYDIGSRDGTPYVVAELLEGETLRNEIHRGALPRRKAIDYARQIAEGLAAAHDRGIVHRDLKPENLFVTRDGRLKILDFGLAKLMPPERMAADAARADLPTATQVDATATGMLMGTVGYMAPEQARGVPIDHRADVFAFGAVLYEMLTGRRAFQRDSTVETLAAILQNDPAELTEGNPRIGPALERVLRHCLEKRPEARFQSARDLAFALDSLSVSSDEIPRSLGSATASKAWRVSGHVAGIAAVAAAVLLGIAGLVAMLGGRDDRAAPPTTRERPVRFVIDLPAGTTMGTAIPEPFPAISPDGRHLAFVSLDPDGTRQIWLRALDALESSRMPGTDGAMFPFWSPDSKRLGFFADGYLQAIDLAGGPPERLCAAEGLVTGATWGTAGVILFAARTSSPQGLLRVAAAGGTPAAVTVLDAERGETAHVRPQFLPDGRHFLYLVRSSQEESRGIHVGSLDDPTGRRLLRDDSFPLYADSGFLLFIRGDTLLAQRFDAESLELQGSPVAVAHPIQIAPTGRGAPVAVSAGVLAYRGFARPAVELVWTDRQGRPLGTVGEPGVWFEPSITRDGRRLAVGRLHRERGTTQIWLIDLERGGAALFVDDPASAFMPMWSPDGATLAFISSRGGAMDLYRKPISGGEADIELLHHSLSPKYLSDWARDGSLLIFNEDGDIWAKPLGGAEPVRPLVQSPHVDEQGRLSPDGRWLAYTSNESGRSEVWLLDLAAKDQDTPRRWKVSLQGGDDPKWRDDGRELFYQATDRDRTLMAMPVDGPEGFEDRPEPLFPTNARPSASTWSYDVTSDGERFLIVRAVEGVDEVSPRLTVVLDWTAELPFEEDTLRVPVRRP